MTDRLKSRAALATATLALLALCPLAPTAVATAHVARAAGACAGDGGTDYDFRPGGNDQAVGVPGEDIGAAKDAGAVEVRYGCDSLPPQGLRLPHPRSGDRFGTALAGGYYLENYNVVETLFVGVPYLDVHGHKNAGGVAEFRGSTSGLHFHKLWTQDSVGVPGTAQTGAHFGASLRLFDEDEERSKLLVGEPGRNLGRVKDTGGVVQLNFDEDPETKVANSETTVRSLGFTAHSGDLFGSSLSSRGIGAPGRTVHGHRGAGAVFEQDWLDTSSWTQVTQDTAGISSTAETGDHFGASLSDHWVGVPDERVGRTAHAGVVQYYDPGNVPVSQTLDQDTTGVPGSVGSNHRFGSALVHQEEPTGSSTGGNLFVGAPGDRGGAGSVSALQLGAGPLFTGAGESLPSPLPGGTHFGAALAAEGLHGLAVGAPSVHGGHVVTFLSPDSPGSPAQQDSWQQGSGKPEAGDGYGWALCPPKDFGDEG